MRRRSSKDVWEGEVLHRLRAGVASVLLLLVIGAAPACRSRYADLDLSCYSYRDTRRLVQHVYDAARLLQEEGLAGLTQFRERSGRFRTDEFYLYVYRTDGTNLYHAGMPELEGRNLWEVTDKDGKPITQLVLEALRDPNNPHAWVHYSWWEPGSFYPVPKSSCHFEVATPEGEKLFVGGGLDYPHEEREFIRIAVDSAADLLEERGSEALLQIADPISAFNYRDVRVFVFRENGEMLVAPAINSTFSQTNLLECADEVGHRPFAHALGALEASEAVWEIFMARSRYQTRLLRKCLYVRKAAWDDGEAYIAAITDLPQPPY